MTLTKGFLFGESSDFGVLGFDRRDSDSFIRSAAAHAAATGRVPWPSPTAREADSAFSSLMKTTYRINIADGLLGTARFTHCGLEASDHFMHDNRMSCAGYDRLSPRDMWDKLSLDDGPLWRRVSGCGRRFAKTDRLDEGFLRAVTRLSGGCYNAAQFKPAVALAVIRFFSAKRVLDPCAGWGDRLVAACAAGVDYVGIDPNAGNREAYAGIIDRFGGRGRQSVLSACFEEYEPDAGAFDLAFTSPPYYDTERYAAGTPHSELQSWVRYGESVDMWVDGFLRPFVANCRRALKRGGILAVNLKDSVRKVSGRKVELHLCNRLDEGCRAAGLIKIGEIGMQMKSAPGNVPKHRPPAGKALMEPILCYTT